MSAIELSASYRLLTDTGATLLIESNQRAGVFLSVLHERHMQEPICYDFAGHDQHRFDVRTGESLTMIVRCQGRIIGCLVNEVNTSETSRVLLNPRGGYNLIVYQSKLPEDLATADPQISAFVRTLHEPTPATTLLADLQAATVAYYDGLSVPAVLVQLLPLMDEAVQANEEAYSRQMLTHLGVALESLNVHQQPQIRAAFDAAARS